jgi:hypothetical protein
VISSSGSACIKNKSISFINLNHLGALYTKLVFCFCQPVFLFGRRVLRVSFCPPQYYAISYQPGEEGKSDNGDGGSDNETFIHQRRRQQYNYTIKEKIECIQKA